MKKIPTRACVGLLAVLVAFGAVFMTETTYSWFLFQGEQALEIGAGKVNYAPNKTEPNTGGKYGAFLPDTQETENNSYISPGRELVMKPLLMINKSTIETNVRVRVTGKVDSGYGGTPVLTPLLCESVSEDANLWRMGSMTTGQTNNRMIPLFNIRFFHDATATTGYHWEKVPPTVEGAASQSIEWELVPQGQTTAGAVVQIPSDGSDTYFTITSAAVTSQLPSYEEELIFTNMYAGKKLLLKVEYLAKQNHGMKWDVFYSTQVGLPY
ncbi:MAG: hypothetical protein RRY25_06220 [Anaerovorax sp.]